MPETQSVVPPTQPFLISLGCTLTGGELCRSSSELLFGPFR